MTRSRSIFLGSMTSAEALMGRYMRAEVHPAPTPPAPEPAPEPTPTPPAPEPTPTPPAPEPTPTPPAPTPTPAPGEPESFDAAFAREALPAPVVVPPGGTKGTPTPPVTPEPTPPAPPAPPAAPEPTPTPPAPPAAPTAAEIAAELAGVLKPALTPETPTPPAADQPPLYTPEENEILVNYMKDWPDVARAEQLTRRAEYHDLLAFVFQTVNKTIAPLQEAQRSMGNAMHTSQLESLVPDYTPLVEADVTAWIDTQPNYLQTGMKAVMQGGTSEEVADLIGRYRAATGAAPAPAPTPAPAGTPAPTPAPAAAPKTELSQAAIQAAESLAPVSGERSQVPVGEDSQDYGSAFDRYAAAEAM